jgi:hypothetical protein
MTELKDTHGDQRVNESGAYQDRDQQCDNRDDRGQVTEIRA